MEKKETMCDRTELILGTQNMSKLKKSNIWVFGVGGVGGYVCEALLRSGVENLTIVDDDCVNKTNLNRQIIALNSTIGMSKVEAFKMRAKDINPDARVNAIHKRYLPINSHEFDFSDADYVVDCIDTVSAKIELALKCKEWRVPLISSMGTGNKIDNTKFEITDIYKTHTDPLAKVMRRELKKRNIDKLTVVYSTAEPIKQNAKDEGERPVTASVPWVPPVGGFIIAYKVVTDILSGGDKNV